jgi:hypothetical protein
VAAAMALEVPVIALFLPPEDDGSRERYLFHAGGEDATMTDLMHVVVPDAGWETAIMDAYRKRSWPRSPTTPSRSSPGRSPGR